MVEAVDVIIILGTWQVTQTNRFVCLCDVILIAACDPRHGCV